MAERHAETEATWEGNSEAQPSPHWPLQPTSCSPGSAGEIH